MQPKQLTMATLVVGLGSMSVLPSAAATHECPDLPATCALLHVHSDVDDGTVSFTATGYHAGLGPVIGTLTSTAFEGDGADGCGGLFECSTTIEGSAHACVVVVASTQSAGGTDEQSWDWGCLQP